MMPAGHPSDSDYTLLPLPKSAITWFGGIFARLRGKCLLGCRTTKDEEMDRDIKSEGDRDREREGDVVN